MNHKHEIHNLEIFALSNILENLCSYSQVPRVFVKGQFIGGGSDVKKLYDSGALQKMLE